MDSTATRCWPPSPTRCSSYSCALRRAARDSILARFTCGGTPAQVAAFLITEALHRITDNPEVESTALLQMGVVGLLVSLTGVVLFRDHIAAFRIRYKSPWAVIDSLGRRAYTCV